MYDGVDVVIAPAIGGVILASHTALHLKVLSAYAEKDGDDGFVIKRGYDTAIDGKRVLIVEDILNTGGSVKKVVDAVRRHSGTVVGVGALCNRGGVTTEDLKVPKLKSLVNMPLEVYDESECPLCVSEVPINTKLGKGREYLARKK
jgi:orotate phosphoribosyltransferase